MSVHFRLASGAFDSAEAIPERYTCEGDDLSPPLHWNNTPDGTKSFVLIMDDPDAKTQTFVHWVLYNLPGDVDTLPAGLDVEAHFEEGERPVEGANDFGDAGYGGPCPPPGDGPHRYYFRLYALDDRLDLARGATKHQVTQAMQDHILGTSELIGTFERGG